jgi:hypothetical protein
MGEPAIHPVISGGELVAFTVMSADQVEVVTRLDGEPVEACERRARIMHRQMFGDAVIALAAALEARKPRLVCANKIERTPPRGNLSLISSR